ncbi:MAG: M56 family metallopeptidase, partial [Verrucomicrobia bacterium]|nr:M56 family metallopeptidase [Verrucomicrobiota bacterium]
MKALISLIQPAFDWTWQNSLQVALLVGLVVLVQTVLARWLTPRLRYALSLLILLRLLLPAVPSSPLSLENLIRPAARLEAHSLAPERGRFGEASLPEAVLPDAPATPIVAEPAPVAPTTSLPVVTPFVAAPPSRLPALSAAELLGLVWACGLLALVSLAGWRYAQWCRLIRQGRRLAEPRLLALLDGARQAMGVRRPVTLVAMARLGSPAVFGFRRVRLLLPETMLDQLTDQDLRLLFLHEMAHVRRHDMLLNLVLMAVQFVHWFNPLLWLGLHRLRADRELVCDAMVLQRTRPEERSGYGLLLLKLLTDFPAEQHLIPTAVPVVSSQRELKRRIISIKHQRSAGRGVYVATVVAAVALACLTFTSSSQQPPVVPESAPLPAPAGQDPCATVRYASDH